MFKKIWFPLLVSTLTAAAHGEEIQRQLGAHVHGQGSVNLAQDGKRFELELALPGANIVGFEHPPRNPEQESAVAQALDWLREGGHWLRPDPMGECAIASVTAQTHGFGATRHDHNHDHGHGHDHNDHDHDHNDHAHDHHTAHEHDHDHAEFHVAAVLECARNDRLGWLELALFERFAGNESLTVNIFTEGGQSQTHINPANLRIMLP